MKNKKQPEKDLDKKLDERLNEIREENALLMLMLEKLEKENLENDDENKEQ